MIEFPNFAPDDVPDDVESWVAGWIDGLRIGKREGELGPAAGDFVAEALSEAYAREPGADYREGFEKGILDGRVAHEMLRDQRQAGAPHQPAPPVHAEAASHRRNPAWSLPAVLLIGAVVAFKLATTPSRQDTPIAPLAADSSVPALAIEAAQALLAQAHQNPWRYAPAATQAVMTPLDAVYLNQLRQGVGVLRASLYLQITTGLPDDRLNALSWVRVRGVGVAGDLMIFALADGSVDIRRTAAANLSTTLPALLSPTIHGPLVVRALAVETDANTIRSLNVIRRHLGV